MDGNQVIFTAFDPVKGRGGEVARFDSPVREVAWDLAPDGRRLAVSPYERTRAGITLIPRGAGSRQEILLKDWTSVYSVAWGAGGDSFLATIFTTRFCSLLNVSMKGDVEILRRTTRSMERPAMSPDGRRLAFAQRTDDSNIWVIENF
jgi:Tol biopolymer transport system component